MARLVLIQGQFDDISLVEIEVCMYWGEEGYELMVSLRRVGLGISGIVLTTKIREEWWKFLAHVPLATHFLYKQNDFQFQTKVGNVF